MKSRIIWMFLAVAILAACQPQEKAWDELESHYATMDSVRVHYKISGQGDTAVIFVHGLGCDLNTWQAQYEAFAGRKGLRLVLIDLPGFGQSDKPDTNYSLEFFAQAIESVMADAGIGRAVLVGHSLGTPICREFTFAHPDQVLGLLDIDGVYVLLPVDSAMAEQYKLAMRSFANGFCQEDVKDYFAGFVISLSGPETPQAVTDYAMSVMPNTPGFVACSTMGNLVDMRYWTGRQIAVPVSVVCTQNSGLEPDNKQRMQELYPNLTYTELTTCGHFIHMEQPETINQAIDALLNTIQ